MSFLDVLSAIGKGALKMIPGVSSIVGTLETVGAVAEAVGGQTGAKIKGGLDQVVEGLREADAQKMTPEQMLNLEKAGMRHKERMAQLDLDDTEGGRALARTEVASEDEYVRRTRPKLLRIFGKATILLIFVIVGLAGFIAFKVEDMDQEVAQFLIYVFCWALGLCVQVFLFMYRIYTSNRTAEKLGQIGLQPETFLDKLGPLFGAQRR
ncbi:hypothetical protein [uncultured Pseudodesulfovibrio sp.]|uniref:hypothetical protein n=1 Tax=uncultured Pseudodesulfovibrio sp. TaxID=2035858 RepID=UPI0029C7952A|nr:hypothetical protein [uncultured Pseudodesulfovibrio sp.]